MVKIKLVYIKYPDLVIVPALCQVYPKITFKNNLLKNNLKNLNLI